MWYNNGTIKRKENVMGKFNTVFGNYLMGSSSVVVEEDLTLQKVHEIVNNWFINKRTNELYKAYNETTMIALDGGLMLFYHKPTKEMEEEVKDYLPSLIIENVYIYGAYVIARLDGNNFVDLTKEDIQYLEGCYSQILAIKKTMSNKNG